MQELQQILLLRGCKICLFSFFLSKIESPLNKIEIQTKQCTGIVDFFDAAVDIPFYYCCSGTINYSCKQNFTSFVTHMSAAP